METERILHPVWGFPAEENHGNAGGSEGTPGWLEAGVGDVGGIWNCSRRSRIEVPNIYLLIQGFPIPGTDQGWDFFWRAQGRRQ